MFNSPNKCKPQNANGCRRLRERLCIYFLIIIIIFFIVLLYSSSFGEKKEKCLNFWFFESRPRKHIFAPPRGNKRKRRRDCVRETERLFSRACFFIYSSSYPSSSSSSCSFVSLLYLLRDFAAARMLCVASQSVVWCRSEWPLVTLTPASAHWKTIEFFLHYLMIFFFWKSESVN